MSALKNIIFDLGGVLINLDYTITSRKFHEFGFEDFEKMYSQFRADRFFTKLETGEISEEEFCQTLVDAHGGGISRQQILEAWNGMLLDWRKASLYFLESLSSKYQLFLLSNTNAIHSAKFHQSLKAETGRDNIDCLFTKAYYSHIVNLRKPDADIFKYILKDAGIEATETLFVDDSANNIETAGKMGFRTHLLKSGELIENLDYSSFSS